MKRTVLTLCSVLLGAVLVTCPSPVPVEKPVITAPGDASRIPITPALQANPPFSLGFIPVEDGAKYILDVTGPANFSIDIVNFAVGDVGIAGIVLPDETAGGTYQLSLRGLNESGSAIGEASESVTVELVETPAEPFAPAAGDEVGGVILATSVTFSSGTVQVTEDLSIFATGPVTVAEGAQLVGKAGSVAGESGVSISISTTGGLTIDGTILAGDGVGGVDVKSVGTRDKAAHAVGSDGGHGGAITLLAYESDIEISATAHVVTGAGAPGGMAESIGADGAGTGADGANAYAEGGTGGNGGDLFIYAVGGTLTVAQVPGLIVSSDGGDGGDVIGTGGNGASGNEETLAGLPGTYELVGGAGGNSGNLTLNTLDWNGDGEITDEEFNVVGGGGGGMGGIGTGTNGKHGAFGKNSFLKADCAQPTGKDFTEDAKVTPKKSGDGWRSPDPGARADARGENGQKGGKGQKAVAIGGQAGNITNIGGDLQGFGLTIGSPGAIVGAIGGKATAIGGDGGPDGGTGGNAEATGGKGSSSDSAALITLAHGAGGGRGGDAIALGGDGKQPPPCCKPPLAGLIGGAGGSATATGGDGGDAHVGGNGGDASAVAGLAGTGSDGTPPGVGGPGGTANPTAGAGGDGTARDGRVGAIVQNVSMPQGGTGNACPATISIRGQLWSDLDADGIQDNDEPKTVPYTKVELERGALEGSTITASATTTGTYKFEFLDPIYSYRIKVTPPEGYRLTLKDQGADVIDSDIDPGTHFSSHLFDSAIIDAGLVYGSVGEGEGEGEGEGGGVGDGEGEGEGEGGGGGEGDGEGEGEGGGGDEGEGEGGGCAVTSAVTLFEAFGGSNSYQEIAQAVTLATGEYRPHSNPDLEARIPDDTTEICTRVGGVLTLSLQELQDSFGTVTLKETFPCGASTEGFRVCGKFPEDPAEGGDWLLLSMVLAEDVPLEDPEYSYQYGFAFDADGNTANNYEADPNFANDFYQGTDRWYTVKYFAPDPLFPDQEATWELHVVNARQEKVQFVYSAATALIKGNTIMLLAPLSEFDVPNPGFRVTAYRQTLVPFDWSADFHPELGEPLETVSGP